MNNSDNNNCDNNNNNSNNEADVQKWRRTAVMRNPTP